MFLRCAILHLETGKISENILLNISEILNTIKENVEILDEEILLTETAIKTNLEAR